MRQQFTICALLLSLTSPWAFAKTPIPIYRIDDTCKSWQKADGDGLISLCVSIEQNLYDGLKVVWAQLPDDIAEFCVNSITQQTNSVATPSPGPALPKLLYSPLSDCVRPSNWDYARKAAVRFKR